MEDVRVADILLKVGSINTTPILVVSLWQQMMLLQGLVPTSLQVYLFNTVYTCTLTESGYHCKRKTMITSLYLPMIFKYVSIQKVDDL